MTASAIYRGLVTHRRFLPKAHVLKYRLFQLLIDLDEAPVLDAQTRLFGFNRPALLAFFETDHGDGSAMPLKTQVETLCRARGLGCGGPVQILCLPRVLGFAFNPISVYFVHDAAGALTAIVHEVNNTVGGRCFYALPVRGGGVIEQRAEKAMYVSPFMDMDYGYRFRLNAPGESFHLDIRLVRDETLWLTADFMGQRRAFTDRELMAAWLRHPLVTLKVVAAIHLEALKLLFKGIKVRAPARAQDRTVTVP